MPAAVTSSESAPRWLWATVGGLGILFIAVALVLPTRGAGPRVVKLDCVEGYTKVKIPSSGKFTLVIPPGNCETSWVEKPLGVRRWRWQPGSNLLERDSYGDNTESDWFEHSPLMRLSDPREITGVRFKNTGLSPVTVEVTLLSR